MNQYQDQKLAKRMLEIRDSGLSLGSYLRYRAKIYLVASVCSAFLIAWLAYEQNWALLNVTYGILVGYVLRDYSRYRVAVKMIPFTNTVTDWNQVEKLASGGRGGDLATPRNESS